MFEILTHIHIERRLFGHDFGDDKAGKGERNKGTVSEEVADNGLAMLNCSL